MKIHTKRLIIKLLLIIMAIFSVYLIVKNRKLVMDIVSPIIISLIIAYLLNPLVCVIERQGVKRMYCVIIIYIVLAVTIFGLCFYVIPVIIRDTGKIIDIIPSYNEKFMSTIQYVQDRYSKIGLPYGIKNAIDSNIVKIENTLTEYLQRVISYIILMVTKVYNYILVPFLLYYFLKDYDKIGHKMRMLVPRKYRRQVIRICTNIDDVFGSYIRIQLILSMIIGVLTTVALIVLGIDFALVIGIVNGITNIIPYFGPIIGAIPAVLLALLQSPTKALYTIIAMFVIQQIESNVIAPIITAESVNLHPVTVMLVLVIGGELFGITGMILCVPVAAALKIIYIDITKNLF